MNKERKDANVAIIGLILLILATVSTIIAAGSVPMNAILAFLLKSALLGMVIGHIARKSDELDEGTKVTLGFVVGSGCVFLVVSTIIVAGLLVPVTLFVFALGFTFLYSGAPHRIMNPEGFIIIFGIIAVIAFIIGLAIDSILIWLTTAAIPFLVANPIIAFGAVVVLIIIACMRVEN
jgi:hypothetical protein